MRIGKLWVCKGNQTGEGVRLECTRRGRRSFQNLVEEVQPEVLVGDASPVAPIDRAAPESESAVVAKELGESFL